MSSLFIGGNVDLKQYFRKIREVEAGIGEMYPLIVSLDTPDGGKAGTVSEVSRQIAAKMIVEGRAVLASEEEKEFYRQRQMAARKAHEHADISRRIQVAIMSEPDVQIPTGGKKKNIDPAMTGK
jgi:hypothetical protein